VKVSASKPEPIIPVDARGESKGGEALAGVSGCVGQRRAGSVAHRNKDKAGGLPLEGLDAD
jgi:hypothetical protein